MNEMLEQRATSFERNAAEQRPFRELVETEHYTQETGTGRGYGVRFHYADGTVLDFEPSRR